MTEKHIVEDTKKRSILKALTGRALEISIGTFVVSFLILHDLEKSLLIAVLNESLCALTSYFNDRIWNKYSDFGRYCLLHGCIGDKFWIYIAGFFDGEGCIAKRKTRTNDKYPIVSLSQKDKKVLEMIKDFLANKQIKASLFVRRGGITNSEIWALSIGRHRDKIRFLEAVFPFLVVKSKRAKEALHWLKEERNIRRITFSDLEKREITKEFIKGRSCEDLGNKYNCSRWTISKTLKKLGFGDLRKYTNVRRKRNYKGRFIKKSNWKKIKKKVLELFQFGRKVGHV